MYPSPSCVITWYTLPLVVYSAGRETVPIQIFRLIDTGLNGRASAYGLALVVMILVPIVIAVKVFKLDLFAAK